MKYGNSRVCCLFGQCCLIFAILLVASIAVAQGFFRVSPGPLNAGHAVFDNSEGCPKCHASGEGVTNQKCLACHGAVTRKGGVHNTFGGQPCIKCHVEHKGRSFNIIEWKSVGGRDTFKHDVTGFSLTEHHGQVACTQCHIKRLTTGRISYLGLSKDCQSCHAGVHGLTQSTLSQNCVACHQSGQSLRGQVLRSWQGPHTQYAKVSLSGKHNEVTCIKCHTEGTFSGRGKARGCAECHEPSHPVTAQNGNCLQCHAEDGHFKGVKVDHNRYGFSLTGKHAKVSCAACHKRGGKSAGPGRTVSKSCVSCHNPTHPVTRATANCVSCHGSGGFFKGAKIDHAKFGLPLLGKHAKTSCATCHKGKAKLEYTEGACTSCHSHKKAHAGQFDGVSCAKCHVEGGKRSKPFDHDVDTKFPLTGFHGQSRIKDDCLLCHPGRIYRTGKLGCAACHGDKHNGTLGKDCERCHSPLLHFNASRTKDFEHTRFPLEGKHKRIACIACHVDGNYQLGKRRCFDCHQLDDKHQGKLGQDCGKCHAPETGAPKFDHERMTTFSRTGAHRQVSCAFCHQSKTSSSKPLTVAGWKQAAAPSLDLTFPVFGKRCAECHSDPHRGNLGSACSACHSTANFERITGGRAKSIRPKDHGGSWLRRHTTLPENDDAPDAKARACAGCHGKPTCSHCHRTKTPRNHTALWRLRTHGTAASFDPNACSTCHSAASCNQCHRRTRPLNHRGAWRNLHGYAAGGFADSNCFVCHKRADCALCHRAR